MFWLICYNCVKMSKNIFWKSDLAAGDLCLMSNKSIRKGMSVQQHMLS